MKEKSNSNSLVIRSESGEKVMPLCPDEFTVIHAVAGEHYRVVAEHEGSESLLDNVIALKVYDDLSLQYDYGVEVIIEDYFTECDNDVCSVTLAGDEIGGYLLPVKSKGVAFSESITFIYGHSDQVFLGK